MARTMLVGEETVAKLHSDLQTEITKDVVKKADLAEFNAHVGDTTIHVTEAERSTWNNKANKSDVYDKTAIDNMASAAEASVASRLAKKADLVDGVVPASQLPSFVDDVLEYASSASFPTTGEAGKIYVALDTNLTYRWTGTTYVEISKSLALGETAETAYAGDKGKAAADAITAHVARKDNPHDVTAEQLSLAAVATSGKYGDLTDTPKIPTALTDLTNATNGGYITSNQAHFGEEISVTWHGETFLTQQLSLPEEKGSPYPAGDEFLTKSVIDVIDASFATKDEPVFTAWRDGSSVKVGLYALAPDEFNTAVGMAATVAEKDADGASVVAATALGVNSYTATSGSLAVAQTPDAILLNSKTTDSGASAKTLRDYMDEAAQRYYQFKTLDSNVVVAENAMLYDLTLTAEQATAGLTITLPYSKNHTQDFIIRLDAAAGATQITSITQAADDGTALSFDWPRGDMTAAGALAADTYYISFTQVGAYRWNVGYYRANI